VRTPRKSAEILESSERAAQYVVEHDGLTATVAELAEAIGLHERTFYRFFPTKADALRPLFDWGAALLADRIAERTDLSVREAAVGALIDILGQDNADRTRRLFPLVFADPALRAVLLAVYHDAEEEVRIALSARTGASAASTEVYFAAAAIVTSSRIALEVLVDLGEDPINTFRTLLQLLPDRLVGESTER
jgi:AcrR family transcriptional regulator